MGRQAKDLTGREFGRLTAIARKGAQSGSAKWKCQCSCGRSTTVLARNLLSGRTRSCGCLQREALSLHAKTVLRQANIQHGLSRSGLYGEYMGIRSRCENERASRYLDYGGRGIECRFPNFQAFKVAVDALGERPSPRHTIDRIDNLNGHYEVGNLRWLDPKGQANNRRIRRKNWELERDRLDAFIKSVSGDVAFVEP